MVCGRILRSRSRALKGLPGSRRSGAPWKCTHPGRSGSSGQPHRQLFLVPALDTTWSLRDSTNSRNVVNPSDFSLKTGSIRFIWFLTPAAWTQLPSLLCRGVTAVPQALGGTNWPPWQADCSLIGSHELPPLTRLRGTGR